MLIESACGSFDVHAGPLSVREASGLEGAAVPNSSTSSESQAIWPSFLTDGHAHCLCLRAASKMAIEPLSKVGPAIAAGIGVAFAVWFGLRSQGESFT